MAVGGRRAEAAAAANATPRHGRGAVAVAVRHWDGVGGGISGMAEAIAALRLAIALLLLLRRFPAMRFPSSAARVVAAAVADLLRHRTATAANAGAAILVIGFLAGRHCEFWEFMQIAHQAHMRVEGVVHAHIKLL